MQTVGLETDSLQTIYINSNYDNFSWKQAKKPVSEWINNIQNSKNTKRYCQSANDYMNFTLNYQFEKKCGNNIMLKGRNDKWMKILPSSNNTFIARITTSLW